MNAQQRAAVAKSQPAIEPDVGLARTYGHFQVADGSRRFYDQVCESMNFPAEISPALLGHFAGPTENGWEAVDVWNEGEAMERAFSHYLVDAISSAMLKTGERVDVEPEMREIARLVVGPDAHRYHQRRGGLQLITDTGLNPVGIVIEQLKSDHRDYLLGCEMVDFPRTLPEGLVLHVAGECADGWRVFDVWHTEEQQRRWYEHVFKAVYAVDPERVTRAQQRIRRIELVRAIVDPRLAGGGWLPL